MIRLLLAAALAATGCSNLLYYPVRPLILDPQKAAGLDPEVVTFETEAGEQIHAWWFASKKGPAKATLVFFHGNAENLSSHFMSLAWMPDEGYQYLIFDYPGYGSSTGKPTPLGTVQSGVAALRFVHKYKDQRPLVIFGQSLGGNVAMRSFEEIRGEIPVCSLVIDSSFDSYRRAGRRALAKSWVTWIFQPLGWLLLSDDQAPRDLSKFTPTPVLFIHGDGDRIIESRFSEEMYEKAREPKELWIIPGGRHIATFHQNKGEYRKRLVEYLERRCGEPLSP